MALELHASGCSGSLGLASTKEKVTATLRVVVSAGSMLSAVSPKVIGARLLM